MSEPNKMPGSGPTSQQIGEAADQEWRAKRPDPTKMRMKPKYKAILAEVSPRMHEAVKAKPEKLRLIAEDEHGNAVVDRPYRRRTEQPMVPDGPHSAIGAIRWGRSGWPISVGNPDWDTGGRRGDELVQRNYDIYTVLREHD
jgi:hypothetical protein